ncbi:NACHT, LRR and PYD domains-containing protein 12 [Eurytemora carolleeae]|uniref:NACHT, LRR and PYD domains-containing protein 12 n=1 Tax=Eurytemora carolleeae TaxID=1294199 RepID=UPI000C779C2F|nr:NACHT, LRR and PYD domains-containing protein 12 [Eurytemora carolleeae]|eukprot:XP_023321296.1 NACHT, LRR and PYD domains-containing protein 12-like [Eurytemora affinis]
MGTHFSKRVGGGGGGHHNGVLSGHEIMAYAFLSGTQCRPQRKLTIKLEPSVRHDNKSVHVPSLSRSPSPLSYRRNQGVSRYQEKYNTENISEEESSSSSDCSGKTETDGPSSNIEIDFSIEAESELESDSGISINLSHFDTDLASQARRGEDRAFPVLHIPPPPPVTPPPTDLQTALRVHFQDEFCEWYEPGGKKTRGHNRRKSSTRSLHQKLVVSKNNIRKATKLDMDDRAKMLQYFTRTNEEHGAIQIEELFQNSWRIPMYGQRLPTVITVQAPAGIGKSSMLKYMCLKWSNRELWLENFDFLIFIECRTLNHIGSMSSKEFICKLLHESAKKADPSIDVFSEILHFAGVGRLLFLLDGLDEITDVANLTNLNPKYTVDEVLTPIELTQSILCGRLAPGAHVIVTSRPHTLTYLQSSRWFNTLNKKMLALDIQGLSEEGVCAFIHSFVENKISTDDFEIPCTELCPCRSLQQRALSDRYIFSLASNPFYLWLLCTIFYEAGEGYVPRTLTQLYTWVILVFSNQWHGKGEMKLDIETTEFLKGFSKLCYNLVQFGTIKMSAYLGSGGDTIHFPALDITLDRSRAQTYGMMVVSKDQEEVECEFRHLSLAEYLSAIHIHTTGEPLRGFAKDRKELILQYLSGLASSAVSNDQKVVEHFLAALGAPSCRRDPLFYLSIIQKMRGEWYNQEGLQKQMLFMRCVYESQVDHLTLFPFPGLKIINIRGNALLTLDLIIINHFIIRLQSDNNLLELSLRDQLLEPSGLRAILPCFHLVRTIRLNGSRFDNFCVKKLIDIATEVRGNLRELYVHEMSKKIDEDAVEQLKTTCKSRGIKTNV